MAPSRVMVILLVLVPLVAMVSADEGDSTAVEDLGAALGRRGKSQATIRRGGIAASGFFSIQGNFQGNFEELGEPRTGVVPFSSDGSSDRVLKRLRESGFTSEQLETVRAAIAKEEGDKTGMKELGSDAALKEEVARRGGFDWTQCKSEGGHKNCAICSNVDGGALPCNVVKAGKKSSECPDDKILKTGTWAYNGGKERGRCRGFSNWLSLRGFATTTWKFPTLVNDDGTDDPRPLVLTKVWVTHPAKASKSVGIVMFKRIVTHKCTGKNKRSFCTKGTIVADVHKVGYCVDCKGMDYEPFAHEYASQIQESERRNFAKRCIPRAIDDEGQITEDFKCGKADMDKALASITGF